MEENLEISSAIDEREKQEDIKKAYDNYCKKILSNKQVLARIMKECVNEYKEVPLNKVPEYIEGTPELNVSMNEKITGMNTEDEKITGSLIRYDILFKAYIPNSEKKIELMINLEAQNKDNPGYQLISRAIYYCSRLLARQKNSPNGFEKSDFDNMKKVYSIWICINHDNEKDDVINYYAMKEECKSKEWHSPKEDYDLMQAIMIYPGSQYDYEDNEYSLLEFLNILFKSALPAKERKRQLITNYGITMTQTLDEEVETMCNLSQGVYEKGKIEGKIEGKTEGKIEGRIEGRIEGISECVKNIMEKNGMDLYDVLDMIGVEKNLQSQVIELIQKEAESKK